MADLNRIVDGALEVARTVAPLLGPQVGGAVAAAEALRRLLDDVRPLAQGGSLQDLEALDRELADLQERVNRHADEVIGRLRGGGGGD